mmetsp:Transcript_15251/g.27718  ORF Transcript_15251/g.27718 Transcript_15251/m.27718 type:complete len:332 (-) Transcript_15251:627-1622(-)
MCSLNSFSTASPSNTNCPLLKIVRSPNVRDMSSTLSLGKNFPMNEPIAPAIRPVLGSFPEIAHLTKGELTKCRPILRASYSEPGKLLIRTRITCPVPSPFRTRSAERPSVTSNRALRNSSSEESSLSPDAMATTVSLVDSSPSILIELNDRLHASVSILWSLLFSIFASVIMYPSIVAIFGSIIPAPLATPTILVPSDNVLLLNFGYLSVVIIASAAAKALSVCKASIAFGAISSANSFAGKRHPITPVDEGSTELAPPGRFKFVATASQTDSAAAIPSPPGQTLETLLLMTSAWSGCPPERRDFPTMTGHPGNLLLVKTAAQLSVGPSVK